MPVGVPATSSWQSTYFRSPLAAFFASVRVAKGHFESVAREPCPRCGKIELTRLAASVAPDHPTTATARADHAEIGVTPREIERRALSQWHRQPRRQHPGDVGPACARHDQADSQLRTCRRHPVADYCPSRGLGIRIPE